MQSLIYVSASYDDAVKTLEELKNAGYNPEQLTMVNRENIINNHLHLTHDFRIEAIETALCVGAGLAFGIMLATGYIHLPDANFTRFTGIFVALCVGAALGFLAAAVVSGITYVVLQSIHNTRYQHLLQNGKFLIFAQGDPDEITYAERVAHNEEGLHWQFS